MQNAKWREILRFVFCFFTFLEKLLFTDDAGMWYDKA